MRERIIDKTVEIWKELLKHPSFDNGDSKSFAPVLAACMPIKVTSEKLRIFGEKLKEIILAKDENRSFWLHVDYHPCQELQEAANFAKLDTPFPWKTDMSVYKDYLRLKVGYGAEDVFYYPLNKDQWLITKLSGPDISKVIEYVQGGKPEFKVEKQK